MFVMYVTVGRAQVDLSTGIVRTTTGELCLREKERAVLGVLAETEDYVSTSVLLDRVWGGHGDVRVVATTIRRLRQQIEPDPTHPQSILTHRGRGYRFIGGQRSAVPATQDAGLFGRDAELRAIRTALGSGAGVVVVQGCPGSGRTALVELLRATTPGVMVVDRPGAAIFRPPDRPLVCTALLAPAFADATVVRLSALSDRQAARLVRRRAQQEGFGELPAVDVRTIVASSGGHPALLIARMRQASVEGRPLPEHTRSFLGEHGERWLEELRAHRLLELSTRVAVVRTWMPASGLCGIAGISAAELALLVNAGVVARRDSGLVRCIEVVFHLVRDAIPGEVRARHARWVLEGVPGPRLLDRVLALTEHSDPTVVRREAIHAFSRAIATHRIPVVIPALVAVSERFDDGEIWSRAGHACRLNGQLPLAEALLTKATAALEGRALHRALGQLGVVHAMRGDHDAAERAAQQMVGLSTDARQRSRAQLFLATFQAQRPDAGPVDFEPIAKTAESAGNHRLAIGARVNGAYAVLTRGEFTEASRIARKIRSEVEQHSSPDIAGLWWSLVGITRLFLGRETRVHAAMNRARDLYYQAGAQERWRSLLPFTWVVDLQQRPQEVRRRLEQLSTQELDQSLSDRALVHACLAALDGIDVDVTALAPMHRTLVEMYRRRTPRAGRKR